MSLVDSIKGLFGGKTEQLTSNIPDMNQAIEKAQKFASENPDQVKDMANKAKQAIPGEADDKVIDGAVDKFSSKQ